VTKSLTVTGGTCASALPVTTGTWLVHEDLSSGLWQMSGASVTGGTIVSENDAAGRVKVTVTSGNETQVTITNEPAAASLKVCKWSATKQLQGAEYSFTTLGQTLTAVAGASAATAGCSNAIIVQPGSRFTVTEAVPDGERVTGVTPSSNLTVRSSSGGVVKVTAGTGANVLTFENEPLPPPQTGLLEICKDAGDPLVPRTQSFQFTVTDSSGAAHAQSVGILVGQCSTALTVNAGNVDVAENVPDNESLADVFLGPGSAGALGPVNLTNGTATVVVPPGPPAEAQVHFVNTTQVATLKICKVLTGSSSVLAGRTFTFDVNPAGLPSSTVNVIASPDPSGACVVYKGAVPLGSSVQVTEEGMPFVSADGQPAGTGETQTVFIGPGINIVTFTNQALGQVEICKNMAAGDEAYNSVVFHFNVQGAGDVAVAAGRCSFPIPAPVGQITISENVPNGFQVVGSNPVTVSVPFFGAGGEALVTFTDRVLRAQVKVCKAIEPGSRDTIGGMSFTFNVGLNGTSFVGSGTVSPPYPGANSCTGLIGNLPVVVPNGSGGVTPSFVDVGEMFVAGVRVSNATVTGGSDPVVVLGPGGGIEFTLGPGPNVATITNAAGS
jgi:hypothetical protein